MSQPDSVRARIEVAVGILLRADGRFLLATRPPGKPYAGYWEFPGGKVERGESVEQALRREMHEELGIAIGPVAVWRTSEHDYPHAAVRLHWCIVQHWQGELQTREGQDLSWQACPPDVAPVLPGAYPVLELLASRTGVAQRHA
nr:NUDIX domain-containing protein [Melaminivora suipulveris]